MGHRVEILGGRRVPAWRSSDGGAPPFDEHHVAPAAVVLAHALAGADDPEAGTLLRYQGRRSGHVVATVGVRRPGSRLGCALLLGILGPQLLHT